MNEEINWNRLLKLPNELREKIVKGKTPRSKKLGEISEWVAIALNRLETHKEMREIYKQIHPSTKYKEFNSAITIYLNSSPKIKKNICEGKINILDLLNETPKKLSKEDIKDLNRNKKARELKIHLIKFYNDLKFFMEGTPNDRKYLKNFLKPTKIHYLAQLLSCIRNEELLENLLKYEGIKNWEEL